MKKRKPFKKSETSIIRSSAAEYLTFIAANGQGGVEAVYADENIRLTQKMMGTLYNVETHTINYHLKKVFSDSELQEDSVIRNFRITAADGKNYNTKHYNLSAIIAVGYKVNSEWASKLLKECINKNFVLDAAQLKNGCYFGKDVFRLFVAKNPTQTKAALFETSLPKRTLLPLRCRRFAPASLRVFASSGETSLHQAACSIGCPSFVGLATRHRPQLRSNCEAICLRSLTHEKSELARWGS